MGIIEKRIEGLCVERDFHVLVVLTMRLDVDIEQHIPYYHRRQEFLCVSGAYQPSIKAETWSSVPLIRSISQS